MTSSKIFLYDKIYIPQHLVADQSVLKSNWEFPVYDEPMCKPCPNKPNRLNDQCKICPGYKKTVKMWNTYVGKDGTSYYTLPAGSIRETFTKLSLSMSSLDIDDRRCDKNFDNSLQFTGKLLVGDVVDGMPTANQEYIVNEWLKTCNGIIEAQPRTGKTVMGVYLSCFLGKKTIIVAHQEELLENFYKTYEKMTNLLELREQSGKDIVKIITKISDFEKEDHDVIIVTYQKFIRLGSGIDRINKLLKNKYSMLIVDECFPKNTLISLADGSKLSIFEIVARVRLGEEIEALSYNHVTKKIESRRVLRGFIKNSTKRLVRIKHSKGEFTCTEDHKVWSITRSTYVSVKELLVSEELRCVSSMNTKATVTSIEFLSASGEEVYDLEVEGNHNYFAEGILVHNCHSGGAQAYSQFLNKLTPKYSLGLSATPDRKDCVAGDTLIYTEKGILPMSEVYRLYSLGERLRVYSKNITTNVIELKPILEVHRKEVDSYREINVGNKYVRVTHDHEFL